MRNPSLELMVCNEPRGPERGRLHSPGRQGLCPHRPPRVWGAGDPMLWVPHPRSPRGQVRPTWAPSRKGHRKEVNCVCVVGRRSRVRVWSAQSTQGFSGEFRPCPLTTASHSPGRGGKAGVQGSFLHPEGGVLDGQAGRGCSGQLRCWAWFESGRGASQWGRGMTFQSEPAGLEGEVCGEHTVRRSRQELKWWRQVAGEWALGRQRSAGGLAGRGGDP